MGSTELRVDAVGLNTLASHCEQLATTIGAASVPNVGGLAAQPSVAAVRTAHAEVAAAGTRLTARMTDTATTAQAAALNYTATDEGNAAQIAAVSAGVSEV